jgi:hypothetical protein
MVTLQAEVPLLCVAIQVEGGIPDLFFLRHAPPRKLVTTVEPGDEIGVVVVLGEAQLVGGHRGWAVGAVAGDILAFGAEGGAVAHHLKSDLVDRDVKAVLIYLNGGGVGHQGGDKLLQLVEVMSPIVGKVGADATARG